MGRALAVAVEDLRRNGGDRGFGEIRNEGGLDPDTGQGIASTHWHQGAAAAHVSVDEETGRLTVKHLHGVAYAGRVVDRPGAELQNEGSLIMGLGTALFEAIDAGDGQVANANLSDYAVPTFADVPPLDSVLLEREGAEVHLLIVCAETERPSADARIDEVTRLFQTPPKRAIVRGKDIDAEVVRYTDSSGADALFLNAAAHTLSDLKQEIIRQVSVPVMIVPA